MKLPKTKYVGYDENGKLLLCYNDKQQELIKQELNKLNKIRKVLKEIGEPYYGTPLQQIKEILGGE